MRLYRQAGNIKAALFVAAVVLVAGLLFYTQSVIRDLRQESRETVSLYARLIAKGITDESDTELEFVFREIIQKVSFPVIHSDPDGIPVNWRNLPGNGELELKYVKRIMRDMDSQNVPIPLEITVPAVGPKAAERIVVGHLHYGDSGLIRQLRLLPYAEIGAVALFILLGYGGFQVIRRNEKQHIWFGMARETAHQLGTPVSSLMGWLERLRDYPEEANNVSGQMETDIARLRQISDRFARMGSSPSLEEVDLKDLISGTVDYFRRRIPQTSKNIVLNVNEEKSVTVRGTPVLLTWVLENIVKNAIDSIDKPTGEVSIGVAQQGMKAVISVRDNGKGIPKRDWKNVFRPGYTTKTRGWGLGLSLAKRIIEDFQRGTISVRWSEMGKGTVFEITIPMGRTGS
ncbi:MAG: HAMP domain-containing sensor histidine kinase [Candidatus Neomarinimicrobiota bacterium]